MLLIGLLALALLVSAILLELERRTERPLPSGGDCPACGRAAEADWLLCPHCRQQLRECCHGCGRAASIIHPYCPWCGRRREEV